MLVRSRKKYKGICSITLSREYRIESTTIGGETEFLQNALGEAAKRATRLGRGVLASITLPVAPCDAVSVFAALRHMGSGDRFFWEQPAQRRAFAAMGAAATIETRGANRFTRAARAWQALLEDALISGIETSSENIGPILFGGFRFDPQARSTELWQAFPDGLLILPRLLFSQREEQAALTFNVVLLPEADVQEIAAEVLALRQALAHLSREYTSEPSPDSYRLVERELRSAGDWMNFVAGAVREIRRGAYEKVVLARALEVMPEAASITFESERILRNLRQEYPDAFVFAVERGNSLFMGATPERLVSARQGRISTMALAGSAPRGRDEQEDARLGMELLLNAKNQGEHSIVVSMIRDMLTRYCDNVRIVDTPRLLRLKNVQHLETPIAAELREGHHVLEVVGALHPTPAVGGFPREAALEVIREGEDMDRGWYAAPIGWLDARGNGEFAVALRSALVEPQKATLFAGCGIVADSDPQSEYDESRLKLQVMLRALAAED